MLKSEQEGFQNYDEQLNYSFKRSFYNQAENIASSNQAEKRKEKPLSFVINRTKTKKKSISQYKSQRMPVRQIKKIQQPKQQERKSIRQYLKRQESIKKSFSLTKQESNIQKIPIYRTFKLQKSKGRIAYQGFQPICSSKYFQFYDKNIKPRNPSEEVIFNSRFESGNLDLAIQVKDNQYNLYMKVDTNTRGHRQWFFFSVKSKNKKTIKLNIFSFLKTKSLFEVGMKPYGKYESQSSESWNPIGSDVDYKKEQFYHKISRSTLQRRPSYFLTFTINLDRQNENLFIASCIPYTYSYLKDKIEYLKNQNMGSSIEFRKINLCYSLSGLEVPLILLKPKEPLCKKKKFLLINGRTHPGQSSSSWVMDGLISTMVNSSAFHSMMNQENITVKIVVMLNVDGVFFGNYRTGILGVDFNRKFKSSEINHDLFPEIIALKRLVSNTKTQGDILFYLDLHGHSISKGCFIFGPTQTFQCKFPQKISKISRYYNQSLCRMRTDYNKIETSRIFFEVKQKILSYTCQVSLGLFKDESITKQFTIKDWKDFGKDLVQSIMENQLYKQKKQQEDVYSWKKSYTQGSNLEKQIQKMFKIQKSQIKLINPKNQIIPEQPKQSQIQSENDEDYQEEDLELEKQKELFKNVQNNIRRKIYIKPNTKRNHSYLDHFEEEESNIFEDRKSYQQENSVKIKSYNFGQNISDFYPLANWQRHKRIFSIPKKIKFQPNLETHRIKGRTKTEGSEQSKLRMKRLKNITQLQQVNYKLVKVRK